MRSNRKAKSRPGSLFLNDSLSVDVQLCYDSRLDTGLQSYNSEVGKRIASSDLRYAREIDCIFCGIRFDVVHITGLLGFGIDSREDIWQMVESSRRTLVPGGYMMLM